MPAPHRTCTPVWFKQFVRVSLAVVLVYVVGLLVGNLIDRTFWRIGENVLVVPRDSVVDLPLTVEEAMRLLVSAGVINPLDPPLSP